MADLSNFDTISAIDVDLIDVADDRRRLDPEWVETLADLFRLQGQKTPIEVIATGDRFRLVFGGHRLAASKHLGWPKIGAVVKSLDDYASEASIKLAEITENLGRRDLSVLDKAVDIASWREIYEAARGAVKRGRPKLHQVVTISDDEAAERFATSFSEAARKSLGLDRMAISRAMRIASIPWSCRDEIALRPMADNQSDLLLLAAVDDVGRQAAISVLICSQKAVTFAEAVAILDRVPAPAKAAGWQKLSETFSRMKSGDQRRFFELHEAAILAWLKERAS